MRKLKLELDDLRVESFLTVAEQPSLKGTVRANSCRYEGDPYYTQYWSTCEPTLQDDPSCRQCVSLNDCLSDGGGGCQGYYTWEESYCQCTAEYSCECAFSEASNCHRCTGP
ncbi:MAG TPA: hypothetical protein VF746_31975 [Longimicrobium sp.]|jgi:hypothetical protein